MSTDAVSFYLNSAGRVPLLRGDEEIMLGRKVQTYMKLLETNPNGPYDIMEKRLLRQGKRAKDRMVLANLRLVMMLAKKYTQRCHHLAMEDLLQEGVLGLIRGVEKFDPEKGYKASTYLFWWIRQAITRAISQSDRTIRLPYQVVDALRKLSRWLPEFKSDHGRLPTIEECMEHTGIKTEETMRNTFNHAVGVISLDSRARGTNDEDASVLLDLIACDRETPWEHVDMEDRLRLIEELLPKLSDHQLSVISSHWGLNGQEAKSFRQIAPSTKSYDREKVRFAHDKAFRLLRRYACAA